MHAFVVSLVVFSALLSPVISTRGIDVSSAVTQSDFSCLKNNGEADFSDCASLPKLRFKTCRNLPQNLFFHTGHVDYNAPQTIANAKAAGINYVDVYMFPCPRCSKSASTQVEEMGQ